MLNVGKQSSHTKKCLENQTKKVARPYSPQIKKGHIARQKAWIFSGAKQYIYWDSMLIAPVVCFAEQG